MPPRVTVVICTHNRARLLRQTLRAVLAQAIDPGAYEVLVIDNGSTDDTPQVVHEAQSGAKSIGYLFEATPGLSRARNLALDNVTTSIIAYLDDDALPEPTWLSALLRVYDSAAPEPSAVGGKVVLAWVNSTQPDWLPGELLGLYSYLDYGPNSQIVKRLHGCNLSFRTDILQRYRFDIRFGVTGSGQLPGEETELLDRLHKDGHALYFCPEAVVRHLIEPDRRQVRYLLRRSWGVGQSRALLTALAGSGGRRAHLGWMLREVRYQSGWLRRAARGIVSLRVFRYASERVYVACKLAQLLGFQRRMLQLTFSAPIAPTQPVTTELENAV